MTLICTNCNTAHNPHDLQTVCTNCARPLEVQYSFSPGALDSEIDLDNHPSLWRYRAFLPSIPSAHRISLGEGRTPLIPLTVEGRPVFLKDETRNPTGSFKDRGLCLAISMARALGVSNVAVPSAGNAAVSAAVYAVAAGINCRVYFPDTIPEPFILEAREAGADVRLAGTTIADAGAAMANEIDSSWFVLSTLKEPYRVEGKKTMGLEIAEDLGWSFPEWIIYPAGGGTGLIGIWKAFCELRQLDWVRAEMPKMVAVQTAGCAPIVEAFHAGAMRPKVWPEPQTSALGLNVPAPLGGAWMLRILRESGGTAMSVPESEIAGAQLRARNISGIDVGPEAAVAWRGFEVLLENETIKPGARVVVIITGDSRRYR